MKANRLREVVTIQHPTETQDASGGIVETWGTFATVRAEKLELSGREYFAAAQVNAQKTVKFRLRYLAGITEKMRLSCDGVTYDIKAILNDRRETLLMCEA